MYNDCASESKIMTQPELLLLKERFNRYLGQLEGITLEIDSKLQKIKPYSEPENLVKGDNSISKPPSSFVEELQMMLFGLERYNNRLETSLRHLNEII